MTVLCRLRIAWSPAWIQSVSKYGSSTILIINDITIPGPTSTPHTISTTTTMTKMFFWWPPTPLTLIQPTLKSPLLMTEQERTASWPSLTVTFFTSPSNLGCLGSPRLPKTGECRLQPEPEPGSVYGLISMRETILFIQFKQRRLRKIFEENFDLFERNFLSHI